MCSRRSWCSCDLKTTADGEAKQIHNTTVPLCLSWALPSRCHHPALERQAETAPPLNATYSSFDSHDSWPRAGHVGALLASTCLSVIVLRPLSRRRTFSARHDMTRTSRMTRRRKHMTRTSRSGDGGLRATRLAAPTSSLANARGEMVPVTAFPSQRHTSSRCCLHSRRRHSRAHSPAQRQATKRRSQRSGRRGTQRKLAGRRV